MGGGGRAERVLLGVDLSYPSLTKSIKAAEMKTNLASWRWAGRPGRQPICNRTLTALKNTTVSSKYCSVACRARMRAYCSRVRSDLNSDLIKSGRQTSCAPCGSGQPQTVVVLVSTFHRMWNHRPTGRALFTARGGHFLRRRLSDKFRISSGVVTVARCLLSSVTETREDPPLWNNTFSIIFRHYLSLSARPLSGNLVIWPFPWSKKTSSTPLTCCPCSMGLGPVA